MLWICIVISADGSIDAEILDSEPSELMRGELEALFQNGDVSHWEIRSAYLNGGDSRTEWQSNG